LKDQGSSIIDKFIEVKSYSGSPYFYWSKNEIEVDSNATIGLIVPVLISKKDLVITLR
jgi:hypothetical protein